MCPETTLEHQQYTSVNHDPSGNSFSKVDLEVLRKLREGVFLKRERELPLQFSLGAFMSLAFFAVDATLKKIIEKTGWMDKIKDKNLKKGLEYGADVLKISTLLSLSTLVSKGFTSLPAVYDLGKRVYEDLKKTEPTCFSSIDKAEQYVKECLKDKNKTKILLKMLARVMPYAIKAAISRVPVYATGNACTQVAHDYITGKCKKKNNAPQERNRREMSEPKVDSQEIINIRMEEINSSVGSQNKIHQ
jgi:hypothetical protein